MSSRALPVLALLVAIGIFFWYVDPTWTVEIAATKAAIASDDSALVAANEYTTQQSELASERNAIDPSNLAKLANFLPSSVDNVGLILNMNKLAADSGVALSNVNVSMNSASSPGSGALPISGASPVGSVDLSLSAVGTYANFQSFLVGIEKSQRLLDTQDISVKGSDTGVYAYGMTIRLYWLH